MDQVMIICPKCSRRIDTGLQATTLSLSSEHQSLSGNLTCAACSQEIHWTEKDLFLKATAHFPTNARIHESQ